MGDRLSAEFAASSIFMGFDDLEAGQRFDREVAKAADLNIIAPQRQ